MTDVAGRPTVRRLSVCDFITNIIGANQLPKTLRVCNSLYIYQQINLMTSTVAIWVQL